MEWNRSNSKGAVAPPHSQQYLSSTSSMVADGQSPLTSVNQHSIIQNRSFHSNQHSFLPSLLKAKTSEEFSQAQQAALVTYRNSKTNRPTNQMQQSLHMSTYKPVLPDNRNAPIPDNRNAIQNTQGSNYRMPLYVNAVQTHQTPQQPPSVTVGQQLGGNVYNTTAVQQSLPNSQALQNYQQTVTYTYPQQNTVYNSVMPANAIQMSCQQMAPNVLPSNMFNLQNGVAGQYMSSQKVPAETNISTPTQNCRNNQNITSQSLTNYRSNMLPHASQQQMSVPQLQAIQQLDGNANCFTQGQQRQTMQNVLISNSSQISGTAATMQPPTYTQATVNSANVLNVSLNQNFNNQRQNYVAPSVQQPAQTGNPPPVQNFIGDGQSTTCETTVFHDRKQEMLRLLLVYRNVRQKYELLNRENNFLRQRLQANTSQENAGPPPLLSSLPATQLQANCVVAGQQNVTQAVPVQDAAQNYSSFHSQNMHDNVVNAPDQTGIPQHLALQENASLLKQMLKPDNGNLQQNNYSVLDGVQSDVENGSTSALQLCNSETTKEVTSREVRGQTNSGNYTSSPNCTNENVLKNGQGLHSLDRSASVTQSLNPACPEKNSYGHLSTSSLIGNGQVTTLSREALEASLPLWKTAPQSTNGSSETRHNQSTVESSLAAFRLLDEITSGPTNEVSSTIPVQKQDSAIPNQANPQIAIVSPLVQSKESLHEDYKRSKVHIQSTEVENPMRNGLINSHETECFNKMLQALASLESETMNNLEALRPKEPPAAIQDNLDSSLRLNTEVSSQTEVEMSSESVEFVDDTLQISGICTLVEGNTFYNSSIAMMFDESSDNTLVPHTDTRNDRSKTEDAFCISKAPSSDSPKATPMVIKSEPVNEEAVGQSIESDLPCNNIPCIDMQADQHMVSNQEESCCNLESSTISDQLTELLTEFPYGIKNYISENILESINGPSGKMNNKLVVKAPASEDYKPVEGKAVIALKSEMVPSPSVSLQHVDETVSEPFIDLKPPSEKPLSEVKQTNEGVLIPAKDVKEESIHEMDTCLDDGFEILSNSPASDIHITILDQEEITKIFPNEHENMDKCSETKLLGLQKCIKTEEPEIELHSLKKDSTDPTENGTDKNLFCCLFSWLNLTNKNAPKCNCKPVESSKVEPIKLSNSDSVSNLKSDSSPQSHEPQLPGLSKLNKVGLNIFESNDGPPKLALVDSENEETLQPMDKPPKLEKMVSETECIQNKSQHFNPQAQKALKGSYSIENVQSVKDNSIKNPVTHEKSLTPSPGNGEPEMPSPGNGEPKKPSSGNTEPTFKTNIIQSSHKFKSHGSRKSEKLIVKTDFLKSKHPFKEKRKSEEKNATNFAQWTSKKGSYQSEFFKNLPDERGKRPQKEDRVEQNMSTARVEQSPDQQAIRSWKRQKSSPVTDMSSHTRGVRKRKEKESHFEKTRRVPSVQEYLERKRELCKKSTDTRTDSREGLGDERHAAERSPEISGDPQLDLKRPLSPAKTNVTPKEKSRNSGTQKGSYRKGHLQSGGPYEAGHRRRKDLRNGQRKVPENTTQNLNPSSSKDKIYLSPCVSSRRASYEGNNLAKLQIRHSPDKPKYVERRKSLESSCQIKPSNAAQKNIDSPKMLEFKLYPEFAHGSPTTQDKAKEAMDPKTKSVVEGIKSSKEAWCNSIPLKKRKVESVDGQGIPKSPTSAVSSPVYKPIEKNTSRLPQDSRTTFNVFKQMYHEQRSKSFDFSQGNS